MDHFERVKRACAKQAARFSDAKSNRANERYIRWILDSLPAAPGGEALDVAAGTGILSRALAGRFARVTAIDLSVDMLQQGRFETERAGIGNLAFAEGNAERLPFADGSFDLVMSRFAFHHFPDPAAVLREMGRVCREAGTVAVVDIVAPDDPELKRSYNRYERLRDPSHAEALGRAELAALFREAGLAVEIAEGIDVPVDFDRWIRLTGTDERTAEEIRFDLEAELAGGPPTGMRPFVQDGRLHFTHAYCKVIARKT